MELPANALGRRSPSITYRRYVLTSGEVEPDAVTVMYDEQKAGRPAVIDDMNPKKPVTVKKRISLLRHFQWFLDDPEDLPWLEKQIRKDYRK